MDKIVNFNKNDNNKAEAIKEIINKFLLKMKIPAEISIKKNELGFVFNIKTNEPNFLIGQKGINLYALQHLIRLVVAKEIKEPSYFVLDVNNYFEHKTRLLKELAISLAEEAILKRKEIILQPMRSYERRIIHLALSDYQGVFTKSTGSGENRRVVIKLTGSPK